jgi:formylglycine-generating enzyme required for sulfatase activity
MRSSRCLAALLALALAGCCRNTRHDPVEGLELVRVPAANGAVWITRAEVPVRAYEGCVKHGNCVAAPLERSLVNVGGIEKCTGKSGQPDKPLTCVEPEEQQVFCAWVRGRVASAEERERAVREQLIPDDKGAGFRCVQDQ